MKIQTNTAANSALGYMKVNAQNTERSIQKLSSGFRINRAADDAAGLAIANSLRADSKTLGQAQKNAAQASAMLQIADGAAGTLGNIFDRMRELASQGASANVGAQGGKLQDEWNALYSEADRIITGTKYQGTNVLTGLTAGAATAGTAGSFSDGTITAASGVPASLANGTYTLKDGTGANAGKLQIVDSTNAVIATSSATVSSGAGSVAFDNGMTLTKAASFTAAVEGVAAANGTATGGGAASSANGFASATSSSSTVNGTYTFSAASNGDVTLNDGNGNTQTLNNVASGAGTLNFSSLGISVTTNASFVTKAAATAGTATASGNADITAAANSTTGAAQNGTYDIVETATGTYELQQGGNTVAGSSVTVAANTGTVTFGTSGISISVGAGFDPTSANQLTGGQVVVANGTDATSMSLATGTITVSGANPGVTAAASNAANDTFAISGQTAAPSAPSILVGTSGSQTTGTLATRAAAYASQDSISLDLGSLNDIDIKNLSSTVQTGTGAAASGTSLLTTTGAQDALARLDKAVEKLNTFVGKLGAAESRVDYAAQNVDSMLQNTQAAESSIRDADMAQEMSSFTKNNILQQAAQSMLSQANQGTQGILQLLRG